MFTNVGDKNFMINNAFNTKSRTSNTVKASAAGVICNFANMIIGFIYRTIFIYLLSEVYLGINGLFTNVLTVLSLADLGIGTAITYSFYKPIAENDVRQVGRLLNYFKKVYRIIRVVVLCLGLCIVPFLGNLINDTSTVPSDVNLTIVYLLYLAQTYSSYLFSYKQTILSADQRQYYVLIINTLIKGLTNVFQIVVLFVYKDFTLNLLVGTVINVLGNYLFSLWIDKLYPDVVNNKESIDEGTKRKILTDTKACMSRKIGYAVISSTDNIILSKYVGLVATGLYSNYTLIIGNLTKIIKELFNNFTGSIGSAHIGLSGERKEEIFINLLFINLWLTSITTICLYLLIDYFMNLWIGVGKTLDHATVICICAQYYLTLYRTVNNSFIEGCGLFVKDKFRPIIQALINIVTSIILVKAIGISGVFLGTVICIVTTVFWRDPYILYKFEFKKSSKNYWKYILAFSLYTFAACFIFNRILAYVNINNYLMWVLVAIGILVLTNIILVVLFRNDKNYLFFKKLLDEKVLRKLKARFIHDNNKSTI